MINVEIEWKYRGVRARGLTLIRPSSPGPPATERNWSEVVGLNALAFFLSSKGMGSHYLGGLTRIGLK